MESIQNPVMYAVLGDLMAIDNCAGGPGRGAASLLWRNRDRDVPAWAGRDLSAHAPPPGWRCWPATAPPRPRWRAEQLGRLRRLERSPTLATVTMGGNDLRAAYGDATAARRAIRTVAENGRLVLASLRALMDAQAPFVVAAVYDLSDGSGNAGRLSLPPWPEALEARLCHDRQRACLVWPCTRWFFPRV
jgi:hypothetical protein